MQGFKTIVIPYIVEEVASEEVEYLLPGILEKFVLGNSKKYEDTIHEAINYSYDDGEMLKRVRYDTLSEWLMCELERICTKEILHRDLKDCLVDEVVVNSKLGMIFIKLIPSCFFNPYYERIYGKRN